MTEGSEVTDDEREAAIARLLLRAAECAPTSLLELFCDKRVTDKLVTDDGLVIYEFHKQG